MCGRYAFVPGKDFWERFEIENRDFELQTNYNTSPGSTMTVVTMNSPKKAVKMKWGLIPFWAKDANIAFKTINARCEEINKKPSFRGSYKNKRCLIPVTGFYEWDKKAKTKVPNLFLLKDRSLFSFAGLYDKWVDHNGREVYTYTILTTKANELVGKIHDRMPVILRREDEEVWANNREFDQAELGSLFRPFPEELMTSYQVGVEVNDPKNNNPKLLERIN